MISPTIGRVVLFWPSVPPGGLQRTQPYPALVSYVWSDRLINIGGFDGNGVPFAATSVPLLQDDDIAPAGYYAEWMPYQKGQAAKAEALQSQLAAAGSAAAVDNAETSSGPVSA